MSKPTKTIRGHNDYLVLPVGLDESFFCPVCLKPVLIYDILGRRLPSWKCVSGGYYHNYLFRLRQYPSIQAAIARERAITAKRGLSDAS